MKATINIANFSVYPGGRDDDDGPYNGTRFRTEFLLPAFQKNTPIIVNFDGTRGYGSSFLEEAFGGLIRRCGYTKKQVLELIEFKSSRESILRETMKYIDAAEQESKQ